MRKSTLFVCMLCGLLLVGKPAAASVELNFTPDSSTVGLGGTIIIDVTIAGLDLEDLGAFDFNVNYDNSILSFLGYTLGGGLGDLSNDDALDLSLGDIGFGQINLAEVSLFGLSGQADSFVLATLTFDALAAGSAMLTFSDVVLSDATGEESIALGYSGVANANVVPIPGAAWLLGSGLLGLAALRKRTQ
jgi:hypothetical protein